MGRTRRKDRHLPKRMYLRRGKYYFDSPVTKKWEPLGEDYLQALAKYGLMAGIVNTCRTFRDVIRRYKTEVTPLPLNGRERAKDAIDNELRTLDRFDRVFGDFLPDNITQQHLYKYIDNRMDERPEFKGKKAPSAGRHDVRFLKKVFTKGIKWAAGMVNPVVNLEFDADPKDNRDVTPEEFAAVYAIASERMQIAMDLGDITAQDVQELRLCRPKTDFKDDGILFRRGKTGNGVLVEWTPALRQVVARAMALKPDIPKEFLLRNEEGQGYSAGGFKSNWQHLVLRATRRGKNGEPPILQQRFKFKHLRKKAATDVSEQRGPEAAQALLAHSDVKTTLGNYIQPRGIKPKRGRPAR